MNNGKFPLQKVGWTNSVVENYELIPLGRLVRLRNEKNDPIRETQVLSLTADRGVILYEEKGAVGNQASEDISRYSVVKPGDIVVNSMNVIIGSVGLSKYSGVLSPVYYVLTPINSERIDMRYLAYHFQIKGFQKGLIRIGYGILDHRMRIPWINLAAELIVVPPIEEQRRIADYLDDKLSKIDSLIERKMQQMELNRQLLGSKFAELFLAQSNDLIPIKRLLLDEQLGVWGDEPGESEINVSVARVADFNRLSFSLDQATTVRSITTKQFISRKVSKGDVLLERSGGGEKSPVGCAVFVDIDQDYLVSSNFVSRLRPAFNVNARYLSFVFAALYMTGSQTPHSSQTTGIQNLDTESFFQIRVPKLDPDQQVAASTIADKIISDITKINSRIESSIESYRALKNALITSSVTGQNITRESISR